MKRNIGLDFLKIICSFMVVCIHIQFPNIAGTIITPITRIAVPIFFMITGYFYSITKENNNEARQIKKIAKLFVGANVLYLLYALFKSLLKEKTALVFFSKIVNLETVLKFVLLNDSPFGGHLWYLGAILYVLIILFFFEKKWSREKLYRFIPILLIIDLALGKYSLLILGKEFPVVFVRNFLCVGLPYFLIGDMLFKIKPKIKSYNLILLTGLFVITTLLERFTLGALNVNAVRDHYISTTFLSVFVFLCAVNFGNMVNNRVCKKCCVIGSELTLLVYILHPIFVDIISKGIQAVVRNETIKTVFEYASPFIVFVVSVIVSWILHFGGKKVKNLLHKPENR